MGVHGGPNGPGTNFGGGGLRYPLRYRFYGFEPDRSCCERSTSTLFVTHNFFERASGLNLQLRPGGCRRFGQVWASKKKKICGEKKYNKMECRKEYQEKRDSAKRTKCPGKIKDNFFRIRNQSRKFQGKQSMAWQKTKAIQTDADPSVR